MRCRYLFNKKEKRKKDRKLFLYLKNMYIYGECIVARIRDAPGRCVLQARYFYEKLLTEEYSFFIN